jgi:F0F1-type ATP synthase membrane subunit b/b'
MKRMVLFVVALVFAIGTTVIAADKAAVPVSPTDKAVAVAAEKVDAVKADVKADVKKAEKKVTKSAKKAEKKAKGAAKKAEKKAKGAVKGATKKVEEAVPAVK